MNTIRIAYRWYIYGAVLAGLLGFGGCTMQRAMLYQPGTCSSEEARRLARGMGLRPWPEDGAGYLGLVPAAAVTAAPPRGTVVVFHGNAGVAAFRAGYAAALGPRGFRVVLAEYPGYGGRPGRPAEPRLVADGLALSRRARGEFGAPLFLWGESMGCGVAAAVAREAGDEVAGLALLTPWDSLAGVARTHYPWLPVRLFLRDRYDNVANLAGFAGPVAVLLAGQDTIVPPALGRRLYGSLGGARRLWVFPECGHNDWPDGEREGWWDEVCDFLTASTADAETASDATTPRRRDATP
jgi:pimeloyl-ACP methyl ester carboxylesterase